MVSVKGSTVEKAHFPILLHLVKYIAPGKKHLTENQVREQSYLYVLQNSCCNICMKINEPLLFQKFWKRAEKIKYKLTCWVAADTCWILQDIGHITSSTIRVGIFPFAFWFGPQWKAENWTPPFSKVVVEWKTIYNLGLQWGTSLNLSLLVSFKAVMNTEAGEYDSHAESVSKSMLYLDHSALLRKHSKAMFRGQTCTCCGSCMHNYLWRVRSLTLPPFNFY